MLSSLGVKGQKVVSLPSSLAQQQKHLVDIV